MLANIARELLPDETIHTVIEIYNQLLENEERRSHVGAWEYTEDYLSLLQRYQITPWVTAWKNKRSGKRAQAVKPKAHREGNILYFPIVPNCQTSKPQGGRILFENSPHLKQTNIFSQAGFRGDYLRTKGTKKNNIIKYTPTYQTHKTL